MMGLLNKEQFADEFFKLFHEKDKAFILDEFVDGEKLLGHPFFGIEIA